MRWLIVLFVLIILVFLICGAWGYSQFVLPGPLTTEKTIVIPRGVGIERIAVILGRHNIIKIPVVFSIGARTVGAGKRLKAGEFFFSKHVSPRAVMNILQNGKPVIRRLTLAEGLTNKQILEVLNKTAGLIGKAVMPLSEGKLLPETYYFSYGDNRNTLVRRMLVGMKGVLAKSWQNRTPKLPIFSVKDAIILASIVEKETGRSAERARVAGVFMNRLRLNMKLQSDPTVIFSITRGQLKLKRALTKDDLNTRSPYNTYYIKGLPPGPITNPGLAAIKAVMNPINTDELYFVADGKGGHIFAKNLADHNKNVAKWRQLIK
jgi:UPF0755 protein